MIDSQEYIPTPEDIKMAESFLTPEQRQQGEERVKSFIHPSKVNFYEGNGNISLDIGRENLDLNPVDDIAKQKGFVAKEEFHITAFSTKNGLELRKALKMRSDKEDILAKVKALVEETDWSFSISPERYRVAKEFPVEGRVLKGQPKTEIRESIIQMVNMPGIAGFYNRLIKLVNDPNFIPEKPPTHITIFTKGTSEASNMGIGIFTQSSLERLNHQRI